MTLSNSSGDNSSVSAFERRAYTSSLLNSDLSLNTSSIRSLVRIFWSIKNCFKLFKRWRRRFKRRRADRASRRGLASDSPLFGCSGFSKMRTPKSWMRSLSKSNTAQPIEDVPMSRPSEYFFGEYEYF